MLGTTEGKRRGRQRMRRSDGIVDSVDMKLSNLQETVEDRVCCSPRGHKEVDAA